MIPILGIATIASAVTVALIVATCVQKMRNRITPMQLADNLLVLLIAQTCFLAVMYWFMGRPWLQLVNVCFHALMVGGARAFRYQMAVASQTAIAFTALGGILRQVIVQTPHEIPMPRRWHFCQALIEVRTDDAVLNICACGAITFDQQHWLMRNRRRKDLQGGRS